MPRKGYSTVALPNILLDEIDKIVKDSKHGYISRPEFIKDAVRRLVSEIRRK